MLIKRREPGKTRAERMYPASSFTSFSSLTDVAAMSRLLAKLQRNSPPCDYRKASEDSVSHFSIAETSGDATVDLPPGVHAVLAPYKLRRKNSNIICDFLVFDGGSTDTYTPDIELRTKNALLDSAVYIDSQDWGRPVSIHARTKNSDLILGIVSSRVHFDTISLEA